MMQNDKKSNFAAQFRENSLDPNKKHFWKAVKNLKSKSTPKFTQMRSRTGMLPPLVKRAETIADYLEKEHWENRPADGKARKISRGFLRGISAEEERASHGRQFKPFSLEELNDATKLTKRGKEPGPDNVRMELVKLLDNGNRKWLLNTAHKWLAMSRAPGELHHARVASIYKNGETDSASKYKPISRLSRFYKLYMILMRTRIQAEVEQEITTTQYGFRPAKNTAHAIYIIRRIQEFAGKTKQPLYMTLLEWEKTFDKVDNQCLCDALERMGIAGQVIEALRDGYKQTTFCVQDEFGNLRKVQSSGIRQGCPLSPTSS